MVDVGRRESAASGGDRRGIVNVEDLTLITTVGTTIVYVRYCERGTRGEYPPVVVELSRACEADLLEHGDKGEMGNRGQTGHVVADDEDVVVGTLKEGTQHWLWSLNMESTGGILKFHKLE